jgi:hypothetical protein
MHMNELSEVVTFLFNIGHYLRYEGLYEDYKKSKDNIALIKKL